ncbi:MAG: S8 family peptidase [Anaerovoracaceae bacterium]
MRRAKKCGLILLVLVLALTMGLSGTAFAQDAGTSSETKTSDQAAADSSTAAGGTAVSAANSGSDSTAGVLREAQSMDADELLDGRDYEDGQLIVLYDDDISGSSITRTVNRTLDEGGSTASAVGTADAAGTTQVSDDTKATILDFSGKTAKKNMKAAIETLQEDSRVLAVQPNYKYRVSSETNESQAASASQTASGAESASSSTKSTSSGSAAGASSSTESASGSKISSADPYLSGSGKNSAWQFKAMNVFEAWNLLGSTTNRTKVAVIDSGCALTHADLQKTLNRSDSKTVQYTAYYNGSAHYRIKAGTSTDESGHGTHVTGIIGATYGNGRGSAGVASGYNNNLCDVTVYDVSTDGESMDSYSIMCAAELAAEDGAQVINMSFGVSEYDILIAMAVAECSDEGICIAGASGNESLDIGYQDSGNYTFDSPASFRQVLAVNAAASSSGRYSIADYSNYGTFTDVTAPGSSIPSTVPTSINSSGYTCFNGTSMASPMAAGVMALVLDANPNLTPAQVYNILCATAQDQVLGDSSGFDSRAGYGLLDAAAAVKAAKNASASTDVTALTLKSGMSSISLEAGDTFQPEVLVQPAESLATVTWTSSSDAAEVDSSGTITARSGGTAVITAAAGSKSVKIKVTVPSSSGNKSGQTSAAHKNYSGSDYHLKVKKTGRRSVHLTWRKIPGAAAYQIQVRKPGQKKYHRWKTTTARSLRVRRMKKGTWRWRVRARYRVDGTSHWYSWSKTVKVKITR